MKLSAQKAEPRKICVAVDGSAQAEETVVWAAQHLVKPTDELHIVTALRPKHQLVTEDPLLDPAAPWLEVSEKDKVRATQRLAKYGGLAKDAGASKVMVHEVEADAGNEAGVGQALRDFVSKEHVDSMVVGSRGLGGFSKSILGVLGQGSVSDYCVSHLPCPVIVHKHTRVA